MQQEKQEPTLIIDSPDGSQIRIYQQLSESYIHELVDEFTKKEGVVNNKARRQRLKVLAR
jgi:(2Fe-2S) ferredoxin